MTRVLCLHGSSQTAEIFRGKVGNLVQKGKKFNLKFHFVDAPHILELREGDDVPLRSWYCRVNDLVTEDSLETSLLQLQIFWREKGGFDGIFGFSMGGSLAAIIASLPERFPGLRFVVCVGSPDVPEILHQAKIPKDVKSLHVAGVADKAVIMSSSKSLASRFFESEFMEHEQAHCIPTKASYLISYVEFMHLAVSGACDAPIFYPSASKPIGTHTRAATVASEPVSAVKLF